MLLLRQVQLQLRVQPLPAADEIRHDLRGLDGGGTFVVSVQLPRTSRLVPRRAQAPVSTGGATRRPEPRQELRPALPAHFFCLCNHRNSIVTTQAYIIDSCISDTNPPAFGAPLIKGG